MQLAMNKFVRHTANTFSYMNEEKINSINQTIEAMTISTGSNNYVT